MANYVATKLTYELATFYHKLRLSKAKLNNTISYACTIRITLYQFFSEFITF
jgi:hypothetical protein